MKPYALFQTSNKTIHLGLSAGYGVNKYACGTPWQKGCKRISPGSLQALARTLDSEDMCKKCRKKLSIIFAKKGKAITSLVLAK